MLMGVFKALTRSDIHTERTLGDGHASKGDGHGVSPSLGGPVGAAVNAVTFVLHHDLHAVLAALRVSDHGGHVSCSSSYEHRITFSNSELQRSF